MNFLVTPNSSASGDLPEPGPEATVAEWRAYMAAKQADLKAEHERIRKDAEFFEASYHTLSRIVDKTLEANAAPPPQRPKKPELPEVDLADVVNWLRRVEAAYSRASVTSPADKLSYLEGKRGMSAPSLNKFFHDPSPNDETWEDFKKYLIERYGLTNQQRARETLGEGSGWRRGDRKPSDLIHYTLEKMGTLTLQDLQKEMVFRELPSHVQEHLLLTFNTDTLHEMGVRADHFFEEDGRTKQQASRSHQRLGSVSHCSMRSSGPSAVPEEPMGFVANRARAKEAPYTSPFDSSEYSEGSVNALGQNRSNVTRNVPPQSKAGGQQRPVGRSRARSRAKSRPAQPRAPTPRADWKYSVPRTCELGTPGSDGLYGGLCWYHARFGQDANRCNDSNCRDHNKQGNARGGRR